MCEPYPLGASALSPAARRLGPHLWVLSVAPSSRQGGRFPLPANCFPGHSGQRRRGPAATWGGRIAGERDGGSYTGPRGRAPSCARPGKWPGLRAAIEKKRQAEGKEGGRTGAGKGKGKGRGDRNPKLVDDQVVKGRRAAGTKTPPPFRPRSVTLAQPQFVSRRHGDAVRREGRGLGLAVEFAAVAHGRPLFFNCRLTAAGGSRLRGKGIWVLAANTGAPPAHPDVPGSEDV